MTLGSGERGSGGRRRHSCRRTTTRLPPWSCPRDLRGFQRRPIYYAKAMSRTETPSWRTTCTPARTARPCEPRIIPEEIIGKKQRTTQQRKRREEKKRDFFHRGQPWRRSPLTPSAASSLGGPTAAAQCCLFLRCWRGSFVRLCFPSAPLGLCALLLRGSPSVQRFHPQEATSSGARSARAAAMVVPFTR